jgi:hypothetical protein
MDCRVEPGNDEAQKSAHSRASGNPEFSRCVPAFHLRATRFGGLEPSEARHSERRRVAETSGEVTSLEEVLERGEQVAVHGRWLRRQHPQTRSGRQATGAAHRNRVSRPSIGLGRKRRIDDGGDR